MNDVHWTFSATNRIFLVLFNRGKQQSSQHTSVFAGVIVQNSVKIYVKIYSGQKRIVWVRNIEFICSVKMARQLLIFLDVNVILGSALKTCHFERLNQSKSYPRKKIICLLKKKKNYLRQRHKFGDLWIKVQLAKLFWKSLLDLEKTPY